MKPDRELNDFLLEEMQKEENRKMEKASIALFNNPPSTGPENEGKLIGVVMKGKAKGYYVLGLNSIYQASYRKIISQEERNGKRLIGVALHDTKLPADRFEQTDMVVRLCKEGLELVTVKETKSTAGHEVKVPPKERVEITSEHANAGIYVEGKKIGECTLKMTEVKG